MSDCIFFFVNRKTIHIIGVLQFYSYSRFLSQFTVLEKWIYLVFHSYNLDHLYPLFIYSG